MFIHNIKRRIYLEKLLSKRTHSNVLEECNFDFGTGSSWRRSNGLSCQKQQHTTYSASQEIVISHNLNENQSSDNGQDSVTNADMNMMPTYAAIAEDETISETAHKMLPKSVKKHYSVQDVNDSVRAIAHQQSLVLTIKAKADSAKAAVEIANATAKAVKKDLPKLQPGAGDGNAFG